VLHGETARNARQYSRKVSCGTQCTRDHYKSLEHRVCGLRRRRSVSRTNQRDGDKLLQSSVRERGGMVGKFQRDGRSMCDVMSVADDEGEGGDLGNSATTVHETR
jgi:hypothetical protein